MKSLFRWITFGIAAVAAVCPAALSGAAPALSAPDLEGSEQAKAHHRFLYVGGLTSPAVAAARVGPDGDLETVSGSPFATGTLSLGMVITPDAKYLYFVTAGFGLGAFTVEPGAITGFRISDAGGLTQMAGGVTNVEGQVIGASITPDGSKLFVTASNKTDAKILSYEVGADGGLTPTDAPAVSLPGTISQLAISPDASTLFASNFLANTVSTFRINSDGTLTEMGSPLPTGALPAIPVVSPDGRHLIISNEGSGDVSVFAISNDGSLSEVAGSPVRSGGTPHGATITPDSKRVYVANAAGDSISGWTLAPDGALAPLPGSPYPSAKVARVVLSPDAKTMFAMTGKPRESGQVSTFRIQPNGSLEPSGLPSLPTGLFWHDGSNAFLTPNQGPLAALSVENPRSGMVRRFSAGDSVDVDGSVVSYHWDFGDGHQKVTKTPMVKHVYDEFGTWDVSVTVTDDEGCSTELVYNGTTVVCDGSMAAQATMDVTVATS